MYPIEFEAVDDTGAPLFGVKCFDDVCSTVEIKTVVTPELWLELSKKIHEALVAIHSEAK